MAKKTRKSRNGKKLVFTAKIRLKSGRILTAAEVGKRCFVFEVDA